LDRLDRLNRLNRLDGLDGLDRFELAGTLARFFLNLCFGNWILFAICDLLFVFSGLSGLSFGNNGLGRYQSGGAG
jgi:hypothetical protein